MINKKIFAGIGMFAGSMIAKMINAPPGMAIAIAISGAVLGGYIGYSLATVGELCIDATTCAVMIIIFIIMIILGIGKKCKPKIVKFTCEPWQPPPGGNCELCNNNPLKPCSEYRCKSLGAACEIINKGTEHELCIDENPNDVMPPTINPQTGVNSPNTTYQDINDGGFKITNSEGGCIDAYTDLVFGVNTNEPAQCRFDTEEISFEEMAYSLGGNYYKYNHTTSFMLPDPSHGQSQGLDVTGETKLYVKCRDN